MSEFKVGDAVQAFNRAAGVVSYGPAKSAFGRYDMYGVTAPDGTERVFQAGDLKPFFPSSKFTVGDKVRYEGTLAELAGGPVVGVTSGEMLFLLKFLEGPDAGKGVARKASKLEPVIEPALVPVGTRVRVDRAKYGEHTHGMVGVVVSNTETFRSYEGDLHPYRVELGGDGENVYAAEVTPVDDKPADGFEYEGVVYEYGALYRDREGDLFRFRSTLSDDGTPQGQAVYGPGGAWIWSLAEVLRDYAPLTKQ